MVKKIFSFEPALVVAFFGAVAGVVAVFGFDVPEGLVTALGVLYGAVGAFFVRSRTTTKAYLEQTGS